MKAIDEAEAQMRLDEVIEEAQRQPVVIRRQGRDAAVIVSMADYERVRVTNIQSFLQVRKEITEEAAKGGLTEEQLIELIENDRW
jgi:prevent-host-death family protein